MTDELDTSPRAGEQIYNGSSCQAEIAETTMFYDGGCPLCSREVDHYRQLDKLGRIKWVDIHAEPDVVDTLGVTYQQAMARLHVRDRTGRVQTGAWAFAAIWEELPYYRWLARALRACGVLAILDYAYQPFASWRLKRRADNSAPCHRC